MFIRDIRCKKFFKSGLPFVFALLVGCSSAPMVVEELNGTSEVAEGEEAKIYWNFKNADYVRIEGIDRRFKSRDTFFFRPDISKNFKIAGHTRRDSIVRMWNVRVFMMEQPTTIQTGPITTKQTPQAQPETHYETPQTPVIVKPLTESPAPQKTTAEINTLTTQTGENSSQYFGGKITRSRGNPLIPSQVKILSASRENGGVVLKTLPLDNEGNFLDGIDDASNFQWMMQYKCNADSTGFKSVAVQQVLKLESPIALTVCLDRSASATFSRDGYNAVRQFTNELMPQDEFGFVYFNQAIGKIALQNSTDIKQVLSGFTLPAEQGLSAVYKAAFTGIDMLDESKSPLKALVIITGNADNSSIIYTADDIATEARKLNIPVYTIRVGDATESYPLKYISSFTGGKYYYLPTERAGEIYNILTEISNAQKIYYVVKAPDIALQNCADVQMQLVLKSPESTISTSSILALEARNNYPLYQALAVFEKREIAVSAEYREVLKDFAEVLKDNPTKIIELTGNSSTDGDDDYNMMIALQRAQTVRRTLVEMGAKASQIRVRAEGNRRPVYYFQNSRWQEDYNRRVEVRWLDPALLPYEITAGIVATEDEALLKSDEWEKRGAKAYYETIYYQKQPAFRVKLWGYSTYGDAATAAREFQSKYGGKLAVE
ncbi:MAG: OmpA family protein [Bacteroidota bacterium]